MDVLNLMPDSSEANCSGANLPTTELKILHLLMSVSGIVCSVITLLFLLVLIVASRAYKATLQRLNIYNIILGLICEIAYALQIKIHFEREDSVHQDAFCEALGFLYVYTRFMWYTFIVLYTNCLLFFALRLRMGKPLSQFGSRCIELICVIGSIFAPLAYIWLPFQNHMYGLDNQFFCWIQYIKLVNGTCIVNNRNLIVVNSVFIGMSAEVILVCFVACVVYCFLHKIVQNRQSASLLKRSQYIIAINISFFVFCVIFIITTFVNIQPITLYISLYFSVLFPLCLQVWITLYFLLSLNIKSCPKFLRFIRTQARISTPTPQSARDFGIDKSDTPTNPTSHPVNRPSYTYFSVPYTGGFTQITDGAQDETEEQTPLIKN